MVADQSFRLGFSTPRTDPERISLLNAYRGSRTAEPVELTYLRGLMLGAGSIQELRRLMRVAEDAAKVYGAPACILADEIREAMSRERSLNGFTREEARRAR